jgi:hypothetical protein
LRHSAMHQKGCAPHLPAIFKGFRLTRATVQCYYSAVS